MMLALLNSVITTINSYPYMSKIGRYKHNKPSPKKILPQFADRHKLCKPDCSYLYAGSNKKIRPTKPKWSRRNRSCDLTLAEPQTPNGTSCQLVGAAEDFFGLAIMPRKRKNDAGPSHVDNKGKAPKAVSVRERFACLRYFACCFSCHVKRSSAGNTGATHDSRRYSYRHYRRSMSFRHICASTATSLIHAFKFQGPKTNVDADGDVVMTVANPNVTTPGLPTQGLLIDGTSNKIKQQVVQKAEAISHQLHDATEGEDGDQVVHWYDMQMTFLATKEVPWVYGVLHTYYKMPLPTPQPLPLDGEIELHYLPFKEAVKHPFTSEHQPSLRVRWRAEKKSKSGLTITTGPKESATAHAAWVHVLKAKYARGKAIKHLKRLGQNDGELDDRTWAEETLEEATQRSPCV
eukprot:scaffold23523_cov31-Prasinocladus_malaysianus.AAC.3